MTKVTVYETESTFPSFDSYVRIKEKTPVSKAGETPNAIYIARSIYIKLLFDFYRDFEHDKEPNWDALLKKWIVVEGPNGAIKGAVQK